MHMSGLPEPFLGQSVPVPLVTVEKREKCVGPSEKLEFGTLGPRDAPPEHRTSGCGPLCLYKAQTIAAASWLTTGEICLKCCMLF